MARLCIYFFGSFHATLDGKPVAFEYDKVRALLAYLVMESDRAIHRDYLAALLWPEGSQQSAHSGLRQAISKLRRALSDQVSEFSFLLARSDTIQFNPRSDVWVDAWAFIKLIRESAGHRHRRLLTCSTCAHLLSQACEIYRGDFLEWFSIPDSIAFEEWATLGRVRMRNQASDAMLQLAAYQARLGDYARAQLYAARQLALDPLSEAAHYQMMRAIAALGNRSQALVYFKTFSRLLETELGMSLSTETLNLVQNIKSGIPIRELDVTNLILSGMPMPDRPMTGREAELREMEAWLESPDRRLITLTGPGGIGKTRLALAVALSQQAAFTHGVVFVNLAPFSSTNSFIPAVLEALHLSTDDYQASEALLFDYFRKRENLLILDSFEYVLESRPALERLFELAPELVVLVTSRVRLNLQDEWIFDLGGLEVPPVSVEDEIEVYSAVSLFVQSARRVRRGFELTSEDRHWVGEICRLVRGMPLAILLAAPWVRVLSCKEIAHKINTNLDFLAASGKDLGEPRTSMRAIFDQSWKMLGEEEQRVLRQLSVFRGGFDRQAAKEVAGAGLEILANLVDQSLLMNVSRERYDWHDLLNQYAFEKLVKAGEMEQVVRNHFLYFLRMAELNESQLEGAEKLQAFAWFIKEQPNLLAALQSASNDAPYGDASDAQRLAALLHQNWYRDGVHNWARSE